MRLASPARLPLLCTLMLAAIACQSTDTTRQPKQASQSFVGQVVSRDDATSRITVNVFYSVFRPGIGGHEDRASDMEFTARFHEDGSSTQVAQQAYVADGNGDFTIRIPAEVLKLGTVGKGCRITITGNGKHNLGSAMVDFGKRPDGQPKGVVLTSGELARMYMRMEDGR